MRSTFLLLGLLIGVHTFDIFRKQKSKNHQDITRFAILRATAEVCGNIIGFGKPEPLDSKTLAEACKSNDFADNFEKGIRIISYHNVMRDIKNIPGQYPEEHFDNELFKEGKEVITNGMDDIINYIEKQQFKEAREKLGKVFHTLQDFYSHSNWIELGNKEPCTALINRDEQILNLASSDKETCHGSNGQSENIKGTFLTSGYVRGSTPKGKCSHGGYPLNSAGINKDSSNSSHGPYHNQAADVSINASVQLLKNIWGKLKKDKNLNFFSHSNWIELGNKEPCTALINRDEQILNLASSDKETCHGSNGQSENIKGTFLTSGYVRGSTPKGKCSHGGYPLNSAGINKDSSNSSHGPYHNQAADVSINASVQLLKNIWGKLKKDKNLNFFRLVGLHSEIPTDAWKTLIPFIEFKQRYPDASVDVVI